MRSHLLLGKVNHRRFEKAHHEVDHDVWYFALDLDEVDAAIKQSWLLGRNRRAVLCFRDSDFLPEPATDLPGEIRAHVRSEGIELGTGRITLVANLRVFGYTFNPASFYLCRDGSNRLVAVVVEVHNTYGERHVYTLQPAKPAHSGADDRLSASMTKDFFVSPFIDLHGRYNVTVRDSAKGLAIGISLRDNGRLVLSTSLALRRIPLTTRSLTRLMLRHPLMTHKTIVLIHWHALRLWLKRVPFIRHGAGSTPSVAAHGVLR